MEYYVLTIPMAVRYQAEFCSLSIAAIVGSIPLWAWMFVSCVCFVLCR